MRPFAPGAAETGHQAVLPLVRALVPAATCTMHLRVRDTGPRGHVPQCRSAILGPGPADTVLRLEEQGPFGPLWPQGCTPGQYPGILRLQARLYTLCPTSPV